MGRFTCFCGAFLCLVSLDAACARLEVGSAHAFNSIHQALAKAANGDTVLVYPGVYHEKNITINKALVFKGINYPVLDGEKKYEIISVKSSRVTVDGFKIQHSGRSDLDDLSGIRIYEAKYVTISNNILDDTFFGIYSQFGCSCIIRDNELTAYGKAEMQMGNGIHCWKNDSMQIIHNTVDGYRDGIYFEFVTNSIIWRNTCTGNMRYGLHFMFSNNDTYISNVFCNNGAGVAVMYTHAIKMFSNVFLENWGDASYGLLLKEISDSYISGNLFIRNTMGIFMDGDSRIFMEKNQFRNNGWALRVQANCMENTVQYSSFTGNTFDVATNGSLVLNKFDHNYWDKYEGYDLNKDKIGDVAYHPVSIFSMIVEKNPSVMILFRSFMAALLDKTERILPSITPENLKDDYPLMKSPI